jgi:TPR repeat protein
VGEACEAARNEDQVRLLQLNVEAQAQAIQGMEETRVLGEKLQRAKAREAELSAELRVNVEALQSIIQMKDVIIQAKDREIGLLVQSKDDQLQTKDVLLQAKDDQLQTKDALLQAKDTELRVLHAQNARLSAGSAAGGAARQPAIAPPADVDAARQGEALFQEGRRLYKEQRFSEAAERWGWAALLRHGPSHAHLSDVLIHGRPGVAQNAKRAFAFATCGAALGCAHSKGVLGFCYAVGCGVANDQARGLALGRESVAAGSCFGQFVVGWCYDLGWGVAQDFAEAVRLFSLAAAQGHAAAQHKLGVMFENGVGVAQDYYEAGRYYGRAAVQSHPLAKAALTRVYKHHVATLYPQ